MDNNLLDTILRSFLREDIGRGDLTSEAIFSPDQLGSARLVARESFLAAGIETVAARVFALQNPRIESTGGLADGSRVEPGDVLLTVNGPTIDLLKAERVALNLLQRLSGIATLTAAFVRQVEGYPVRICDTRKTTPGLRMLEKYAVVAGGGHNHRFNLADGILIKDNHIAACGSIAAAVERVRLLVPHTIRIEVETDTLEQVEQCLDCGVDIILLDNMPPATMAEAVAKIDGRAIVEASGGISLETVRAVAASGVDIISAGALTHSAPACDIGMDWSSTGG
ncbi:carboxylating nicotinate-nucleotide diphosphorylase [Desulfofustis glycolicus]|uniref:Probable nicotinate-nucleotide pyrophosphorylase [carboxylating] n=1 Tax=Desulfofustis glycolicus DSM 9705 TaxID=1121409 RepID=A0A1M5X5H1_9BACT|nr:carboxylating nicotinate-nucleotide diphosphorylase [Desulfofustis glycolicus]MCB2216074.1 carboxylating nicotinate-nucleotide diphosphorylase [Desulfobulbaceae bacterium]SHH95021.1 nicotinate-nucleotide pyrophosphorylase [carboxylating] [Desulfofustis glycolicus DSM 9705]